MQIIYLWLKVCKLKFKDIKGLLLRIVLLAVLLSVSFVPIYFIFKKVDSNLWTALTSGNQAKIVEAVEKYDNRYGMIIISILQFVQDFSIIIPSAPIHISAGIVLGKWKGFLVCHLSDLLYNVTIFLVYKKIKKNVDKIAAIDENSKTVRFLKEGLSPAYMVALACIIPAIPNGFIPYAAASTDIKLKNYFFAVAFGAAVPTFVLTTIGGVIFEGNWLLFVFLIVLSFVGVFLLLRYQKRIIGFFHGITSKSKNNSCEKQAQITTEAELSDITADLTPEEKNISKSPLRILSNNYTPEKES